MDVKPENFECEKTELSGITDRSHKATATSRPVTCFGHQKGDEFSEGGSNFTSIACTKTMVMHTICPRHFFRGEESFSMGAKPSLTYGPDHQMNLGMQKSHCRLDWYMGIYSKRHFQIFSNLLG